MVLAAVQHPLPAPGSYSSHRCDTGGCWGMFGTATAPTSTPTWKRGTSWGGMWRQGHERDDSLSLAVRRTPKAREEQRKGAAEGCPDVPGPSGTIGTSGLFAWGGSQTQAVTWGQVAGRQPGSVGLRGGTQRGRGSLRSHAGGSPHQVWGIPALWGRMSPAMGHSIQPRASTWWARGSQAPRAPAPWWS